MMQWPAKNDYIDIHSHHQVKEKGVFRIVNQFISNREESVFEGMRSVGLHPWHIKDFSHLIQLKEILETLLLDDLALFVGECGLDKNISISLEEQQEIFSKHIQASEICLKPLIIHCVKAHQELLALKKKFNPKQAWIIHGFNGSPQLAANLVEQGFYLSVGHSLLSKSEKANEVLKRIPQKKLFIETDESEVSIQELYSRAAIHLQMGLNDLQKRVSDNFIELFQNDR